MATGECDALIGVIWCVVRAQNAGPDATGRTGAVVNCHEIITGDFTRDTEFTLPYDRLSLRLKRRSADDLAMFDASDLAKASLGDRIYSNMMIFGRRGSAA